MTDELHLCRAHGCRRFAVFSFWCPNHYRRVDYWTRKRLLYPGRPFDGSGSRREWPDTELAICDRIFRLTALGFGLTPAADLARSRPGVALAVVALLTREGAVA